MEQDMEEEDSVTIARAQVLLVGKITADGLSPRSAALIARLTRTC